MNRIRKKFKDLINDRITEYFDSMKTIELLSGIKPTYKLRKGTNSFFILKAENEKIIMFIEILGPGKNKLRAEILIRVDTEFDVYQHLKDKKYIVNEFESYKDVRVEISKSREITDCLMLLAKIMII